jgi:hypothetical protein
MYHRESIVPLTRDIGRNIKELKRAHPDWPHKRVVAAAINGAESASKKSK